MTVREMDLAQQREVKESESRQSGTLLIQSHINPGDSGSSLNFEEDLLLIENDVDEKADRHKGQ